MTKTKEERRHVVRENLRGGNGGIGFSYIFEKSEMLDKCNMCAVVDFEPGTSIGEHPHDLDAELYFILEGELTVTDNGVRKILRPGDALFTGGGNMHSVSNDSGKPAKMLAMIIA